MTRIQISTNVSERTKQQANELMGLLDYSLRDVVSIAIDRMHRKEIGQMPKKILAVCGAGESVTAAAERAGLTPENGFRVSTDWARTAQGWFQPKPSEGESVAGVIKIRPFEQFYVYRIE